MSEIKLTNDNFKQEVYNAEGYVLVDFWAPWCGPCKMLGPVISEIAENNSDIKVGKVNVDEEMELATMYQVSSIPTLILFKDGKPVNKQVGFSNRNQIENMWK